jgi:hydrogenase nickel incorporation protein HypA/HybF
VHESQLARQVLHLALARAPAGTRVVAVRGWVAETETLSRPALELHFGAHARGTAAEGARLVLELRHVSATCACGAAYLPEHHVLVCPSCGGTDAVLSGPTGLTVEAIDVVGP